MVLVTIGVAIRVGAWWCFDRAPMWSRLTLAFLLPACVQIKPYFYQPLLIAHLDSPIVRNSTMTL